MSIADPVVVAASPHDTGLQIGRGRWGDVGIQAASIATGLVIWEVYGRRSGSDLTFPPLSRVVQAAPSVVGSGEFWEAVSVTLRSTLVGLLLSLLIGFALGVVVGMTRLGTALIRPFLNVGIAAPMVAVIPVVVAIFGLTLEARLTTVVLFAAPIVAVNVAAGYRDVPLDLVEMAQVFGVSRVRIFAWVRSQKALPAMITGARLGVGRAYVGVIVVELLVLTEGMGRLLVRFNARFEASKMYVMAAAILVIGVLCLKVVGILEKRALAWRDDGG